MTEINWIQNLAIKALQICRLNKEAAGNHRQDMSLPILENLRDQGYTQVTWNSNGSMHEPCRDLNRQVWDLDSFIGTTDFEAGIFSRSHPGDSSCTLIVSGEGVPNIEVDSYGDVDTAIGTSKPVKAPVAPKPQTKILAPKPTPKVIEKPVAPEKKIKYVSPEVHKQIDPFKKQEVIDEVTEEDKKEEKERDLEDWLKNLEQENVVEEIPLPANPTEEEKADWLADLERETSLKPKQWITSLFKR